MPSFHLLAILLLDLVTVCVLVVRAIRWLDR